MIITRLLSQETVKNQLIVFCILLFIFLCQKLVKILDSAVNCELPSNLVIYLLALGIPEMTQLILPLSLFLGILITLSRFSTNGTITVMYACGMSKMILVKMAMILALITGIIAVLNVTWIGPISSRYQYKILTDTKANLNITPFICKQFQKIDNGNSVIFIESKNKNYFKNIFLARLHNNKNNEPSVIIANSGYLTQRKDGSQVFTLNHGIRSEEIVKFKNFYITDFQNYKVVIDRKMIMPNRNNSEQLDIRALLNIDNNHTCAELHWRLTLVFIVFMVAIIAVPVSNINPRKRRVLFVIPAAILLYLIFFLLQGTIRSNGSKGKLNSALWVWLINSFYLLLAVLLNTWDTIVIRRVRAYVKCNLSRKINE